MLSMELPYDPEISLLVEMKTKIHEKLHTNVLNDLIHFSHQLMTRATE